MNGKFPVLLCNEQEKEPDRMKNIFLCRFRDFRSTVESHVTSVQAHMYLMNVWHLREKNHIAVGVFKNCHI